ncbi:site-specific tyrosine recombinase/integron integrase [Gordonibacter massiliensis (ex Traore et al. 2017)]|uniref:site-specific tyrosine recombinase/integron integrase n=1 Tax=Gordonibacter massiliensis (ex Traore et al. 2017) TaxID=1841863 RepID=UPI001C8BCA82|nr:site-specific tyrosine recombinase/integron integrase [Gordonibacter massiliensis (ex Traore et al. 2017)]MBX9033710.1 tyrosine-type recombinase/integrase [Gordonibacter massiliensis (ex Traore et al. 2017)]
MNEMLIAEISSKMTAILTCQQLKQLNNVLKNTLLHEKQISMTSESNDLLSAFLTAKEVEGCSPKTLVYYETTIQKMINKVNKPFSQINTDDLREYLTQYQEQNGSSRVTIDNIRRIFSSFFSWLEDEDYIVKSPVRRIHKIKTALTIKEVLSDEHLEALRDGCRTKRDLAIVDLLASTGMRIGELVLLDKSDINLAERECIVLGKGNKERQVYFDARAKLHLQDYLSSRTDANPALFVSLNSPHNRISIGGIELRLRVLGRSLLLPRVHPHKFRRTLATSAIDKGMPIEQVQKLLGHARIDTTMHYALVSQSNVKQSHRKYLG